MIAAGICSRPTCEAIPCTRLWKPRLSQSESCMISKFTRAAALTRMSLDEPNRKRWARHGSTRWLWKPQHVSAAIQYVAAGQGDGPSERVVGLLMRAPSVEKRRFSAVLISSHLLTVAALIGYRLRHFYVALNRRNMSGTARSRCAALTERAQPADRTAVCINGFLLSCMARSSWFSR